MEKDDSNTRIEDAIFFYRNAKNLEKEGSYEYAKEKYQVAAQVLIDIINTTKKSDPKYAEYRELANEILSKAEKWKQKLTEDTKRGIASYLFGKHVRNKSKDAFIPPPEMKRRTTTVNPSVGYPLISKPDKNTLKFHGGHRSPRVPFSSASALKKPQTVQKPKKITVSKDIVDKLSENIISPDACKITFSDIKGQKEVKKAISDNIILPLMNPELFSGIREPSRAILLYGPPGNGKTLLAKALAGQVKRTFFNISASSLMSKFLGEGEKMMRGLFKLAEEIGPSIIFFDEIDSLLSARGEGEHEASRRMKTEFLVQFDGVGSSTNGDILIIAATNRPFDLDDAVLRRFPKKIFIGLPDSEARSAIIKNLLKDEKCDFSKSELKDLVSSVKGYSSSDLTALWKEAAMGPLNEFDMKDLPYIKKDDLRPINIVDFETAMEKVKPSYSMSKVNDFIKWEKSLGK